MDEPDLRPRRTFAVISHPDAGKSTLTEALALHAAVIAEAGAVHGKGGRKGTVSDWMDMEKARGISITSTALQFPYRDCVINLNRCIQPQPLPLHAPQNLSWQVRQPVALNAKHHIARHIGGKSG